MKGRLWIVVSLLVGVCLVFGTFGCAQPEAPPTAGPTTATVEAPPTEAKVFKWSYQDFFTRGTLYHDIWVDGVADRITEASGGRLEVTPYAVGELVGYAEMFDALRDGSLTMSQMFGGVISGKDPMFTYTSLALSAFTDEFTFLSWIYTGGGAEIFSKMYGKWDVQWVGALIESYPDLSVWSVKVPIRQIEDFEGLVFRTGSGEAEQFVRCGVAPTFVSTSEVYTAFERGLADAGEFSGLIMDQGLGLHEVCKYFIEADPAYKRTWQMDVLVNQDAWNELPADLKAIVKSAINEANIMYWAGRHVAMKEAYKLLEEYGVEVIVWSKEESARFWELGWQVTKEWASVDPLSADMVESVAKFTGRQ